MDCRYPFTGHLAKEPLGSRQFVPVVLSPILKPNFDLFLLQNEFNLFIEMPLHCFSYKIVILTPI
jgi:hypothetical protein